MPLSPDLQLMAREARWWMDHPGDVVGDIHNETSVSTKRRAERLMDVAGHCYRALEQTRLAMATNARMYSNMPIIGLTPRLYRHRAPTSKMNRLTLNLIKSVIDTYTALITQDQPKVSFETSGGNWSLQQKAKLLEKFMDGIFYETDLNEMSQTIVRDCAIWGIGIAKVYLDTDGEVPKIKIDRVFPHELLIDDQDWFYGSRDSGQCLYQYKYIDRFALMERYPELAEKILHASSSGGFLDASMYGTESGTQMLDQIIVVEGWHLASVPGKKGTRDGRHTIACGDVVLVDEEYEPDYFPFAFLYRQKPLNGLWGQGLADELQPQQIEISRLMQNIQRSQRLAVGHWLVEENSRVNTNAINDVVASIIRYTGIKPEYIAYQPVSADVYQHLWNLWAKGFEVVGISQLAANAQKPAGLNSGKAMLVYSDVQSQRFQPCYREYQHWFLNIAHQIIHLAREASDMDPSFEVKATGSKQMMRAVKWADANLADEEFTLKLYPTNKLADDPAARMKFIQDMINAGMIPPEDGKRLLDFPDLESVQNFADASYDNVMRAYDSMVERDEYFPPEPYMDIQSGIKLMQMAYLKARLDNVPTDKLELIRRWIDEAAALLPPPPPPAPPPGPGANGVGPHGPDLQQRTQEDVQRQLAGQAARNLTGQV